MISIRRNQEPNKERTKFAIYRVSEELNRSNQWDLKLTDKALSYENVRSNFRPRVTDSFDWSDLDRN
jgi:hypothetical protein